VGDYIAKTDIPVGGVLAYTRGQRVTADAVEANGWQDHVVGDNTQEAREIKAELTGRDPADFETKKTPARPAASKQEG
jgi:hypothetical protein